MLDSPAEQQEIAFGYSTWIGLHRDSSNKSRWQWIDGSLAVYLNFDSNEPNNFKGGPEDCVEMDPSRKWKWNDLNCNTSLHYSCELSSGRSRYFRTTRNDVSQMFSGIFLLKKSHNGVD